ncbi:MAG: molybdenum cofactor biosynthesis protein MoaE [Microthrixaceae bacterium]
MTSVCPAPAGDRWTGTSAADLPVEEVSRWLVRDDCGASVVFTGMTRDHSEDRSGVTQLTYEAWDAEADRRIEAVESELRTRWPGVARVAIVHRTGPVPLGEPAVVVGVSSAHRDAAFEAARFGIDAVKASVPIWKQEHHEAGVDWGSDGTDLVDPSEVPHGWADHARRTDAGAPERRPADARSGSVS